MTINEIFCAIEVLSEEYLGVWEAICNIESPTEDKGGVDKVGKFVIDIAKKHGWGVEINEQSVSGNAVCITMNANAEKPPVCLSGHMDTVHPKGFFGYPPVKIDRTEGKMYGPGVVDCKGGIASSLLAMVSLEKCGYRERPVKLILQSDEEISSITSNKETVEFMAKCAKNAVAFLNCEGASKGKVTLSRKGIIRYNFEVVGVAAHSANCYEGVNAICEAAYKIIELEKWKDKDGITCNCGMISGGTAANTVADSCTFTADIRYCAEKDLAEIEKRVREIADTSYLGGTSCSLVVKSQRICMEKCDRNIKLLEKINEILESCGMEKLVGAARNGGSDAADMTSYGIPTLDSLGTSGGEIHSKNEWANISSLSHSARIISAVIFGI